jgi:hypothetical protein
MKHELLLPRKPMGLSSRLAGADGNRRHEVAKQPSMYRAIASAALTGTSNASVDLSVNFIM